MLDVADDVEYNRNVGNEIGAWLSLVERCVRDAKAAGSNPVIPTKNGKQIALLCGLFFYCQM